MIIVPDFDIVFQNFFLKKRDEEVSRPGQIPNQKPIVMVINCLCDTKQTILSYVVRYILKCLHAFDRTVRKSDSYSEAR